MSEYKPDDWRRLARLLRARRAQIDARFSKRTVFCRETGLNYKLVSDAEGAPATRTTFEPETFTLLENAYRWAPGSIDRVLRGGDPAELGEPVDVYVQGTSGSVRVRAGQGAEQTGGGLQAAIRELAKRLHPEDVRALLEEFADSEPAEDNPYTDVEERRIWSISQIPEPIREHLIVTLRAWRSAGMVQESERVAREARPQPTAEVHEFRQRS